MESRYYAWRDVVFGTAKVRVSAAPVDVEASRWGGGYILSSGLAADQKTLARYTASGSVDTAYADRGIRRVDVAGHRIYESASGHLYVLGSRLSRLTPTGEPDLAFDSRPAATVCPPGTIPGDLHTLADGALVLCIGSGGAFVARLTDSDETRPDYGVGGRAAVPGVLQGRTLLDGGGNARVQTTSADSVYFSAFDGDGRPLHPSTRLAGHAGDAVVFDDGTTWATTTYSYPTYATLGLRGVAPDGRPYGPWPVAPPIALTHERAYPVAGPLVRGSTGATQHYGYFSGANTTSYTPGSRTMTRAEFSPNPRTPTPLSPQHGSAVTIPTATLSWHRVPDAAAYEVALVSYERAWPTSIFPFDPAPRFTATDTTLDVPISLLESSQGWAWRVRARTADGIPGVWSSFRTFTTRLPQPVLVTRYDGRKTGLPVSLAWEEVALPTGNDRFAFLFYDVVVSTSRTLSPTTWRYNAPYGTTSARISLLADGVYYWGVQSYGRSPLHSSPFSVLDSFVVGPATGLDTHPEAPIATAVTFPLWLAWSSAPEATSYEWEISPTRDFATIAATGSTAAVQVEALVPGGTYFWRVRGRSGTRIGDFSIAAPFSVAPPAPVLLDLDTLTPTPVVLTWSASAGAERYRIRIRSTTTTVLDTLLPASQTRLVVPLASQRSFIVSPAAESGTTSVWGPSRSITTLAPVPTEPLVPTGDVVVVAPNPTAGDLVVRHVSADGLRYDLVSVLGTVVARGELPEGEGTTTIPRTGLSPGVYVLRVYRQALPAQAIRVVLL